MIVKRIQNGWENVEVEGYTPGAQTKVMRHTLVGGRNTTTDALKPSLELRYFVLPPGAVTRLEKHEHEHYVIVGEGVGHAIVGPTVHEVRMHDIVYVAPLVPHQFVNRGIEAFGIFCVVTSSRDFSQLLSPQEIAELEASPAGAFIDPYGAPPPGRASSSQG